MSATKESSYIGYQEMVSNMNVALEKTGEVMTRLELPEQARQAKETSDRLKSHIFSVGIMGEFKRGKSTVINALLGKKIAPADVVPASATLNRITYGLTPKATVVYKDGHREEVPVDSIADYVTKITEESAATAELVDQAVVEYPCQFCKNNVEIIDTPGLNDDERMDAISEAVIPELDAVVLVLSAGSPFSKSEAEFVRNKLMTSDVTRMIVLVNRIDTIYDEDDRIRLLQSIKEKIVKEILERTQAIHGADSRLYQETKDKLADLKIYPISAAQALQGRLKENPALVEQSGILEFEERLRKLLTEERGVLEVTRVSGIIASLLQEGRSALELRINTLEMDTEEFLKNKKESEKEIQVLRENKNEEKNRIRQKGMIIKEQMDDIVAEKYRDLRERLDNYLRAYPIDVNALKGKAAQEEFQKQVQKDLEKQVCGALSEYTEQINVFLREQMGEECLRLKEYVGTLSDQLQTLNGKVLGEDVRGMTATVVGVDALSNLVAATCTGALNVAGFGLMGLGGLIEGYRASGVKGAATGLAGGFVASNLAAIGLFAAVGSVPFLPFALITGVAGTMGGKLLASTVWKRDIEQRKREEICTELQKTAVSAVDGLKQQRLLENWAQKQVEAQVDHLIDQVERETESMISSTETTLQAIAADMVKATQNKEERMEEYHRLEGKLNDVRETLTTIMERVSSAQPA